MPLSTEHLGRCIKTLERSYKLLQQSPSDSIDYEVARNATVKSFELCLETAGKILRKLMRSYFGSPKEADALTFKDVFRHASKRGLLSTSEVERWFSYRDNRNNTAHDYGVGFAENTLKLLDQFLIDIVRLKDLIDVNSARS